MIPVSPKPELRITTEHGALTAQVSVIRANPMIEGTGDQRDDLETSPGTSRPDTRALNQLEPSSDIQQTSRNSNRKRNNTENLENGQAKKARLSDDTDKESEA